MPSAIHRLPASSLLAAPWSGEPLPAAFVEIDGARGIAWPIGDLPPFPVVGIGVPDSGLARSFDLVVSDEAEAERVARNCARNPRAAAVLVQLLRLIDGMSARPALVAESMAYGLLQAGAEHRDWLARRAPARDLAGAPGHVRMDRDGPNLIVWLDRPAALNAVDRPMRDGLREAFEVATLDPEITGVVLAGAGRAFSVGAELAEFGTTTDPVEAHAIRTRTLPAHGLVGCAHKLEARIHGACIGAGLEMAAFARTVTATAGAWFQLPELAMGLIPGAGGCVSLSRRIGRQRTAWLVLTGRRISAPVAHEWGLVDRIVPG